MFPFWLSSAGGSQVSVSTVSAIVTSKFIGAPVGTVRGEKCTGVKYCEYSERGHS